MRRPLTIAFAWITTMAVAHTAAAAANPESFVRTEHTKLTSLLRQSVSVSREAQVSMTLGGVIDYEELTQRAFGSPCPAQLAKCVNHWAALNDAQKTETRALLRKLIEKNYKKNLTKTLDYEITYKGATPLAGNARVRTEAKSKAKLRDPAVQVDYLVRDRSAEQGVEFRVVDIITEGSSLTKNYYEQFHKMLITAGQGYPHIVKKINEKLAKKE